MHGASGVAGREGHGERRATGGWDRGREEGVGSCVTMPTSRGRAHLLFQPPQLLRVGLRRRHRAMLHLERLEEHVLKLLWRLLHL